MQKFPQVQHVDLPDRIVALECRGTVSLYVNIVGKKFLSASLQWSDPELQEFSVKVL